ncbi:hypothetical protein SMICM304S_05319 [Streptomyces microflavus]
MLDLGQVGAGVRHLHDEAFPAQQPQLAGAVPVAQCVADQFGDNELGDVGEFLEAPCGELAGDETTGCRGGPRAARCGGYV